MTNKISALRLGGQAKFEDRWRGTMAALEITEDWEVVNVVIEAGFLAWRTSIRLPLTAATTWDDDHISFSCTSGAAFRHEVPPIAVPSRPVGRTTPLSVGGATFAGALVQTLDRQVTEVLISRNARYSRVPVAEVTFEGKVLAIGAQQESLSAYRPERAIEADVRKAVREDQGLTGDDKRGLKFTVSGGIVTIGGNARIDNAVQRAAAIAGRIRGVADVQVEAVDDLSLESVIGLAVDKAGLSRNAQVYARSALGVVTLYGDATSAAVADDVARAVGRVPGVREVVNRLEIAAAAA